MEININIKGKHLAIAGIIAGLAIAVIVLIVAKPSFKLLGSKKQPVPQPTGKIVDIIITSAGFDPATVEINQGDTVRWTNHDELPRWPASNPHPTHDDYPGFDPQKEIPPHGSWEFTFLRGGEWGYHDHLSPHLHGTVVVKEGQASSPAAASPAAAGTPAEITQLLSEKDSAKQAKIVRAMAEKYGTLETLAYMRASGLPFTGETHLLVHEVGNVAYEKYGDQALQHCDDSFLSACYHGVILNELGDHGLEGVASIISKCKDAGVLVFSQCAHAAGHGFLAWKDYHVMDAVPYCDKLHEMDADIPVFNCQDGVFMENIFGVHHGKPSPNRMVKESDSHYPCDAIPDSYQPGCWANQATLMYQLFKGDLRKVAQGCDTVRQKQYQDLCYNNFARQIHPMTQGQAGKAVDMCKNATGQARQDECLVTIANAAFSVGDVKQMPYELCATLAKSPRQSSCYDNLFGAISYYNKGKKSELCQYVKEPDWREKCVQRFSNS
jgi:plastocyanin